MAFWSVRLACGCLVNIFVHVVYFGSYICDSDSMFSWALDWVLGCYWGGLGWFCIGLVVSVVVPSLFYYVFDIFLFTIFVGYEFCG